MLSASFVFFLSSGRRVCCKGGCCLEMGKRGDGRWEGGGKVSVKAGGVFSIGSMFQRLCMSVLEACVGGAFVVIVSYILRRI